MRIVIDMQSAQSAMPDDALLALALGMARKGEPGTIHILLNSAMTSRLDALRRAFSAVLPAQYISEFEPAWSPIGGESMRIANEAMREFTLARLRPDIVLAGLPGAIAEPSVMSVGAFAAFRSALLVTGAHETIDHAGALPSTLCNATICLAGNAEVYATALAQGCQPHRTVLLNLPHSAAAEEPWNQAALAAMAALRDAAVPTPVTLRTPVRRRLAFVSPMPPERTGIADYAAQLLPALTAHFDIELVLHQAEVILPPELEHLRRRDANWFMDNAHLYDQIIYQFGNSPFHSHMFALLEAHPGVVVLHDFFLSNLLAYEQMTGGIPYAWATALRHSHGLQALHASQLPHNHDGAMKAYPCNLQVLEHATRVIVHSTHARELAGEWYGNNADYNWTVVPLPRSAPPQLDRVAARAALGIDPDAFVVCSFGYITPTKLAHTLLEAWLASSLCAAPHCKLILVGANDAGPYGQDIDALLQRAPQDAGIRIAGWTDEPVYRQYLQAADVGVQLRANSRGETSAAVLDCMNYGLATIANANGSMASLPLGAVWLLPDQFELAELVDALEVLYRDTKRRLSLGQAAAEVLAAQHRPEQCAVRYRDALDLALEEEKHNEHALLKRLALLPGLLEDEATQQQLAERIARAPYPLAQRQLLVDVTAIAQFDLKTGIERVVRTQLLELLKIEKCGLRIEPVYLSTLGGRWHYRYAHNYVISLLGIACPAQSDPVIDMQAGDIFYSADYSPAAVSEANRAGVYAAMRARGLTLNFVVYDLLPVLMPQFFPSNSGAVHSAWLRTIGQHADRLTCISSSVAADMEHWLDAHGEPRSTPLKLGALHLGADIQPDQKVTEAPVAGHALSPVLMSRPSFLMVGTIEPRKGHLQTLAACDVLWREGVDVNLVIVGSEGWKGLPEAERRSIPELVQRLNTHPERGQRLFWLQNTSDSDLQQLYASCACLIAASEGEGFGLPLIEAAHAGLPIIARALPVFKEVADEHAFYFDGMAPQDLASAMRDWLTRHTDGTAPPSRAMPWWTWRDNALALVSILTGNRSDNERDWPQTNRVDGTT